MQADKRRYQADAYSGADGEGFEKMREVMDADTDENTSDSGGEGATCAPAWLRRFVHGEVFSNFFSFLIFANLVSMLIQADHDHISVSVPFGIRGKNHTNLWGLVNPAFLYLFVIELTLRIFVMGCRQFFVTSPDHPWNIFDFFIILVGVVDFMMRALSLGHHHGKAVQIARVLRILRVFRIVRLLRSFRELRMLARGLIESVTIVFWIFFLILFMIVVFAIFFTEIIVTQQDMWKDDDRKEVLKYFGSVQQSMFTLFQFLTLDNWNGVDETVIAGMPWLQVPIFAYITIAAFVILSLLTGVMADHMDQVRKDDQEDLQKENRQNDELAKRAFERIFHKGKEQAAHITKKEFDSVFADRSLAMELQVDDVELDSHEAAELFEAFDRDSDGVLLWEEFMTGIADFRRGLTMLQLLEVRSALRDLERYMERTRAVPVRDAPVPSTAAQEALAKTEARVTALDARLSRFDTKVKEMMAIYNAPGSRGSSTAGSRGSSPKRSAW